MKNGVRYAFPGNVHDPAGQATYCHNCQALLIGRNGYEITAWHLSAEGNCDTCRAHCAGVFNGSPGTSGSRRMPVAMSAALPHGSDAYTRALSEGVPGSLA